MYSWFNCQSREHIFLMSTHSSVQWCSDLFISYTILNMAKLFCSDTCRRNNRQQNTWSLLRKETDVIVTTATLTGFRNHKGQVWLLDIFQTSTKKQTPHCAKPETVTCTIQIYNCKQRSKTRYQIFSDNCHLQLKTRQLGCTKHHWVGSSKFLKWEMVIYRLLTREVTSFRWH